MSTDRYFINFPLINYNGANAVDITERAVITDGPMSDPMSFYTYDISSGERPDQLSNRYYGDSFKSWIIYLSNQIIDPYYGWYLRDDEFQKFIVLKYSSVVLATEKTKHYQNNWAGQRNISVSEYDALPPTLYRYWEPVYGVNDRILAYSRVQEDYTITTNGVRSYGLTHTTNTFIADEICNVVFDSTHFGTGQVMSVANGQTLFLQHFSGETYTNSAVVITSNSYVYGQESGTNVAIITAADVVDNLRPEEIVYWSPVSYFDYETNKNEYNKSITVLNSGYAPSIVQQLKGLLRNG